MSNNASRLFTFPDNEVQIDDSKFIHDTIKNNNEIQVSVSSFFLSLSPDLSLSHPYALRVLATSSMYPRVLLVMMSSPIYLVSLTVMFFDHDHPQFVQ